MRQTTVVCKEKSNRGNLKNTKKIKYRGILTFEIPETWTEEYDDEHGGSFYEDTPLSGTLRLKLMTLKVPQSDKEIDVLDVLDSLVVKQSIKPLNQVTKSQFIFGRLLNLLNQVRLD